MITFDTFYTIQRVSGLSQDDKPMGMKPGSIFMELDTGKKFIFDGETWHEQPQGGGGIPAWVESVTTYTHPTDWLDDSNGNAQNFFNTYCNGNDTSDRYLYVCYIEDNTASGVYRADYFMSQRYGNSSGNKVSVNLRSGTDWSTTIATSRSFHISAGAKITVIKIKGVL